MPTIKYKIDLTDKERAELVKIVKCGKSPAKKILRANILLASEHKSTRYMTVAEIAQAFNTTTATVQTVRSQYCDNGLEATLKRKKRETPPRPQKLTGDEQARIIALCCSDPPIGYERWTVRLLTERCIELANIPPVNYTTVHRLLKKTNISLG